MSTDKPTVRVPALAEPMWTGDGFMSDGLVNFVSRVGTASDKSSHGQYAMQFFSMMDAEAAYRTSWLRKIVDIPPFDEVREWRTWTGADDEQITLIDAEEKRLGLRQKVKEARTLARKDGGSAIVIGTGGNAAASLDPEAVMQGGIKYLTVVNRLEITPAEQDRNPNSPTFGQPLYYTLYNGGQGAGNFRIHPSRVIRFLGNPIRTAMYWDGWGDSIWIELRDAIRHADQIAAGVSALVDEAKVDVVRLKNLMNNLATAEGESLLVRRWGSMGTLKSLVNALLLDADDEYEQKQFNFAGLPDVQDRALMIMSGMADIPATRLLGRSPQGMNATGDSDMRNYYDRIRAFQQVELGPLMGPLDDCLVRSALGSKPEEIFYEWNPLYTLSEKEAADVEKVIAEALGVYVDKGILPADAVTSIAQDGIIERGQMPGAQKAFDEAEMEPDLLAEPTEAEIAAEEAAVAMSMAQAADPAGFGKPKMVAANDTRFTDATPRSLYVRRDVVNKADLVKWATAQGFTDIVPDLHVTIAYSTTPVDWFKVGTSWSEKIEIAKGGPRQLERLGVDGEYIVLLITASELVWRNREIIEAGATSKWPEYQPHISIQVGGDVDISKMKPYTGRIVLGPEIFEEVKP